MSRVQSDRLTSLGVKQSGMGVIGYGSAVCEDIKTIKRKGASLYADPAAWLVLDAMEQALNSCSAPWQEARKEVGVISLSDRCTLFTMNGLAGGAQNGQVSPLRFAGANPGSITGLPCIMLGCKGPTLTFSMKPAEGMETAMVMASAWLRQQAARFVVVNTYDIDPFGHHAARSIVLTQAMEWREEDHLQKWIRILLGDEAEKKGEE